MSVRIRDIQFNADYSPFVNGDVITVDYDDTLDPTPTEGSTTGYIVYLNGSPSSPSSIPGPEYGVTQEGNNQNEFCFGTSLVQNVPYGTFYPFAITRVIENSPSCIIDEPPCDLITTIPIVTPATNSTSADGIIQVQASSSRAIEYSLNSDFIYGDGTGQASDTFTDLLPGSYRVYLRDTKNCGLNVVINVGFDNTYGPKYRLEFDDLVGGVNRFDIAGRTFSGSVTEVCGYSGEPVKISLRGEGDRDKFTPLLASQIEVTFVTESEDQFQDLFTEDVDEFRLTHYVDGVLNWVGKLVSNQYQEEYKHNPYAVSFIATDGLSMLKDFPFRQDDGLPFTGKQRAIKIVALCLDKLKYEINIRTGVNLYASEMDKTDSDDPLDQAYVDLDRYYLVYESPTYEDVLRAILDTFGARIIQWGGVWNIVRVIELCNDYAYREFDYLGDYVTNGTGEPLFNITSPQDSNDVVFANNNQNLEIVSAYGKLRVVYNLGLKPNLFPNGDFRLESSFNETTLKYEYKINTDGFVIYKAYPMTVSYTELDGDNIALSMRPSSAGVYDGSSYIKTLLQDAQMGANDVLTIKITFSVPATQFEVPYQKVRFYLKYGAGVNVWLTSTGAWSNTFNLITYYSTDFNKYGEIVIQAKQPSPGFVDPGEIELLLYHSVPYQYDYADFAALRAVDTIPATVRKAEVPFTSNSVDYLGYYELLETVEAEVEPNIIRPTDYNSLTNKQQWVMIAFTEVVDNSNAFYIDKIQLTIGGQYDKIIRETNGQARNKYLLEREVVHGFASSTFSTLAVKKSFFNYPDIIASVVPFELIYTGYLRDSSGDGYEFWTRDGVAESTSLHAITLREMASQYKEASTLLRGSLLCNVRPGLMSCFYNTFNSKKYLPMGITINVKSNIYDVEMIELVDIFESGGSDGTGEAPYSSGFTTGFGASGFN